MKQSDQNRIKYLDGLRAVAVLAVLIYHNDNSWLPGGYLGVEVFFVISGFIITQLLYKEWQQFGRIKFWQFYQRRWMRLFPVLLVVILAAWVSVLILHPEDILQILADLPYSLSFTSNLDYVFNERSYFEISGRQRLLEHLWSLGIEFQFYIIWPITCLWLFRQQPRVAIPITILCVYSGYAWMAYLYLPDQDPSRVYFGTDTRIGALLIGALVAMLTEQYQQHRKYQPHQLINRIIFNYRWLFALTGLLSFALILAAFYSLGSTSSKPFYGGLALTASITGVVIFYCHNIASMRWDPLVLLLSNPKMTWLGLRSYGIYLWHWPIFCLTQPVVDINLEGFCLFQLRLAATLVCAEITYKLVELPFRHGLLGHVWHWLSNTNYYHYGYAELTNYTDNFAVSPLERCAGVCQNHGPACWVLTCTQIIVDRLQLVTKVAFLLVMVVSGYTLYVATATAKNNLAQKSINAVDYFAAMSKSDIDNQSRFAPIDMTQIQRESSIAQPNKNWPQSAVVSEQLMPKVFYETNPSNGYIKRMRTNMGRDSLIFGLGDSVMISARNELMKQIPGFVLDAKVGRQMTDAVTLLTNEYRPKTGSIILIHLGNNGPFNTDQLKKVINKLDSNSKAIFINLKLPRNYATANNRILETIKNTHNNVEILDWYSISKDEPLNFAKDGIHLTEKGAMLYAKLVHQALCDGKAGKDASDICLIPTPNTVTLAASGSESFPSYKTEKKTVITKNDQPAKQPLIARKKAIA